MNKSFTLIEILVVIVVIGVLSAFILVGMSSITSSANVAKSKAFINSMDNSLLLARVSQWKFDERTTAGHGDTFIDSWGSNTGTLSTGDGTNNKVSIDCPFGKCLSFDGINDYVGVPNNDSLNFGTTGDFTVSVWVKVAPISNLAFIVSKEDPALNKRYNFYLRTTVPYIQYVVTDDAAHDASFNINLTNRADDNNWHLLSATTDRGSVTGGKLYLDGVLLNTVDVTSLTGTTSNTNQLTIGMRSGNSSLFFPGLIDDVRVYNQAIPTSEIQTNYYLGINNLFKNNGITLNEFNQKIVELKTNLSKYE